MRAFKFILKLLISTALIIALFYKIDLNQFKGMVLKIGILKFFLLSLLYIFSQIISSIRWSLVVKSLNKKIPVFELLRAYFMGMYANMFLPSIIGGDAVKAYLISKKTGLRKSVSSIFLERYNGLLALLFISLFSTLAFSKFFNIYIVAGVALINIFSVLSVYMLKLKPFQKYTKLKNFCNDIIRFHKSRFFMPVSLLSLFVQAIVIAIYILAGFMLGLKINIIYYLAFIPIINLISFLPISFNGIGVREFSFVYFFAFAGLNRVQALSLSISVFFVVIFCSIIGGIVYFVSRDRTVEEAKEFYREKRSDQP